MLHLLLASKISYGLSPEVSNRVGKIGYDKYLELQLAPKEDEDRLYQQKFQETQYTVEIDKKQEKRNFTYLKQPIAELFAKFNKPDAKEKNLPAFEVYADTWLRALYSEWQLKEMVVEFWHNHFNINVEADNKIAIALPAYNETIRKHCFGNFRELLEAIAKSPAMLYYLDNYNSKASPANENYARELFELHTLGADSYLNHLYNRWKEVPNALQEKPIGYIDEDVYEAARAFTGWTVADGRDNERGGRFANTGDFLYYESWHDNYQKRVLGLEFPPNQAPLADGLKVLDLVAAHPATAKFICTKLCRRFVADTPPESLVKKASDVWQANLNNADQIKKVLQVILTSEEFKQSVGKKAKRPFELIISAARALQMEIIPNQNLMYMFERTGQRLFKWATPTGNPDTAQFWHTSNLVLARWNLIQSFLLEDWHKITKFDFAAQIPPALKTAREITEFWLKRFLLHQNNEQLLQKCANYIAGGGDIDEEPFFYNDYEKKIKTLSLVALMVMSPDFQNR